ncbi:MAG: hypothetical protein IPN54_00180 [Bacteroidetes bacterium]|nr:hypothetical protein [Bacteroidota bacterium]MBK9046869.1 hypothetical protein [Bacteroidota bacterium]MBK9422558.1 hypothetical protein [Bacteroidota bacterium]
MKNLIIIATIATASFGIVACSEKKSPQSFDEYRNYVMEHRNNPDSYMNKDWMEIEKEYDEQRVKAEKDMKDWSDEMKTEYASLQSEWESLKAEANAEKERMSQSSGNTTLYGSLLPEGINSELSNVTASNILNVHEYFVNYTSSKKDEMTREEWDQTEILWERLGTRKNELEKEISGSDNMKIAEQKVRYGAIKATNRPTAKADENSDAKK